MAISLQGLYGALAGELQDGNLTLAAGAAQAPAIDGFLGTLPAQRLTLQQAQVQLSDQQWPATLVVSGGLAGSWALPGLAAAALIMQTATITYVQDGAGGPVTAGMAVTGTLPAGAGTLSLAGSLGDGASLSFAWSAVPGEGSLSLADAAILATDGQAASCLPAEVPLFASLLLSSFTLSFGYGPGAATTMEFSLAADPGATWEIVPGQHVLRQIGVSFVSTRKRSPGGSRCCFGCNIHATLRLGQDFGVVVRLQPGGVWVVDVAPSGGLPALEDLAAIVGAEDEVRTGLQSAGLGDITLQAVRLGIDRSASTLAYISMQGSLSLAGKVVDVYVQLPEFEFGGALSDATPISLAALLEYALGDAGGLPDVAVSELSLMATPLAGCYSLAVNVDDGLVTVGKYGFTDLKLDIDRRDTGLAAGISAAVLVAGSPIIVSGSYGLGWEITGQLDQLPLSALIADVLADAGLPEPMISLDLRNFTATWNLSSGSFAFSGEADLDVDLGPQTLTSTFQLSIDSSVDPQSAQRVTSGQLTGSVSLGGMVFGLHYDFTPGQQVLRGTWDGQGSADFAALAAAFGIDVPATDVTLPDLSLTSMSFEIDLSGAGQQAFRLTAATPAGAAFFIVDRPGPGQPWGFVFGAAIGGATRLSQVLAPVGVTVDALDFITLGGAFFLVSSAQFPSLQVPGFPALAGQQMQVDAGVSAGVLADLGATPDRPDVTALKTLLSGRPPVLLGELTLSTNLAAIAVTLRLDGSLKITGAGASSLTLTGLCLIFKPEPVALTLRGSIEFPVGDVTLLATGLLTAGVSGLTAAFAIQGENGQALPIPMGFQGVHLTDIGVELMITLEPPSVAAGLLGRFVIGPGPALPAGTPVPGRSLTATPPPNEFVMIFGLDGEIPNPLLLSMYLQELSFGTAVEALTNQQPQGLPDVVNDLSAYDLMIYWCDAPAGIEQPDGTWAYAGFGFNATLDFYGFRAHAALKIDSAKGITGDACIDPIHLRGVIDLTGGGPGTPASYTGQGTVQPGGAVVHVSTLGSPYLDIEWALILFSTASASLNAQLTKSGFTFDVNAAAQGFSSVLNCSLRPPAHLEMAFSVMLNTDIALGDVNGIRLGSAQVADTGLAASLVADVSTAFTLTISGGFDFHGTSYTIPELSVTTPFASLADIPAGIIRQVQDQGQAIFQNVRATAGTYLGLASNGLVVGGDEIGSVLRTAYGQTAGQAAAAMKTAGYAAGDVASALLAGYSEPAVQAAQILHDAGYAAGAAGTALQTLYRASAQDVTVALKAAGYPVNDVGAVLKNAYGMTAGQAAQILATAGYAASDTGSALISVWGASADEVATDLKSVGYPLSDVGTFITEAFGSGPGQLYGVLQAAGYATDQINGFFDSLGGQFAEFVNNLDPTTW